MKTRHGAAWAAAFLGAALLSACGKSHQGAVASANGQDVPRADAVEKLRAILWRQGEEWDDLDDAVKRQRRHDAVEACVNERLLAAFVELHASPGGSVSVQAEENFQQFLKQFEPPDGWDKRAALQGLDAASLKKRITAETAQTLALETWLKAQPSRPTETNALAWYDAHHASLTVPEQLHASEIFLTRFDHDKDTPDHVANIDRSADIQEVSRKLKAHEGTFAEFAAKFSEDDGSKKRRGDMGWFSRERLPKEFVEKVFALPIGQVSEPFESHLGYHIVLVQEKHPAHPAEFAEMMEQISALLDSNWREETLKHLRQKLHDSAKIEIFEKQVSHR